MGSSRCERCYRVECRRKELGRVPFYGMSHAEQNAASEAYRVALRDCESNRREVTADMIANAEHLALTEATMKERARCLAHIRHLQKTQEFAFMASWMSDLARRIEGGQEP